MAHQKLEKAEKCQIGSADFQVQHDGWAISCTHHSLAAWDVTNSLFKGLHIFPQDPAVPLQPTYYIFINKVLLPQNI